MCISNISCVCKGGCSYLSSSCFTTVIFLLSVLLPQANTAYDHAWQTFQPWKRCLFLTVICAVAKRVKKNPSFPGNVNRMDRLIICSMYQPTPSEAACSLLSATIACLWSCYFNTSILLYLAITPVSASVCENTITADANKTKKKKVLSLFCVCLCLHRTLFLLNYLTSYLPL